MPAERTRSLSELREHAADLVRSVATDRQPLVITDEGTAKVVLQDVESYRETQETLALLQVLALGNESLEGERWKPAREVFAGIRARLEG